MRSFERRPILRFESGIELTRLWLKSDPTRAQRVLSKHSNERVLCMCRTQGVPMQIVNRSGVYHLASMPGRGRLHDRDCPSYIEDRRAFALQYYSDQAITLSSDLYRIRVSSPRSSQPPFEQLTPSAALQLIWEVAGLCNSHPSYIEERTHHRSLSRIAKIACRFRVNGEKFVVYLPFRDQSPLGCRYVVAPVYSLNAGPYAAALRLKGDFENTFWISEDEWINCHLDRYFGSFSSPEMSGSYFVFAKLWSSNAGNYRLYNPGFLKLSPNCLPVFNLPVTIYDDLIAAKREFSVVPPMDSPASATLPLVICIDRPEPQSFYPQDFYMIPSN